MIRATLASLINLPLRLLKANTSPLVTIQEPAWEEFSEDEAPPPPAKVAKTSSAPSSGSQAAKPKKPAPKGQGNIMSFFSKK